MRFAWLLQPHKINDKIWGVRKDGHEGCRVFHCVFYFTNIKVLFRKKRGYSGRCGCSVGGETGVCLRAVVLGGIVGLGAFSRTERGEGLCWVTARQGHLHQEFPHLEGGGAAGGHLEADEPDRCQAAAGKPRGSPVKITAVSVGGEAGVLVVRRHCGVTSSHLSHTTLNLTLSDETGWPYIVSLCRVSSRLEVELHEVVVSPQVEL